MGSALASSKSALELAGIGAIRHGGSFWHLLMDATPGASHCQSLATETKSAAKPDRTLQLQQSWPTLLPPTLRHSFILLYQITPILVFPVYLLLLSKKSYRKKLNMHLEKEVRMN